MQYAKHARDAIISLRESLTRSMDSQKLYLHHKLPKIESLKNYAERTTLYFQYYITPKAIK